MKNRIYPTAILIIFFFVGCNNKIDKNPVVKWTAQLPDTNKANLGFDLLENTHTTILYKANPETGTYSHHPHITYFKETIYTTWSNHKVDEDAPGQRVLMRRSIDQGETWDDIVELFPPLDHVDGADKDGKGRRTQCANGFAIIENTLYAFSEVLDDGGDARHVGAGQGRLFRSIHDDETLGKIFWLRKKPARVIEGIPEIPLGDPELVDKINAFLQLPENELTWDFRYFTTRPKAKDGHQLCEPTPAWQLNDGTWVKIYRDIDKPKKNYFKYASFSFDNGKEWTIPTITDFPDADSRANAGVLPDGQIYVISNVYHGPFYPLTISLSKDGLNFDRVALIKISPPKIAYKGRWKSNGYKYPHSLILGDNLWVIYDIGKEDVLVTRIPISEIINI